eukprot:101738_1
MTVEIENVYTKHDTWTFIQNKRATESASFKVLQQFVLSLNKHELQHLIECYLKLKTNNFTESTVNDSVDKIIYNNSSGNINDLDGQILNKMCKKYGNKYNKKIIKKIQQIDIHTDSKHILGIPPQVLAYSFQYLSFKELSQIEHVCSYFTYLSRKFEGLSHFYINLNHKFWTRVMRNQININRLNKFKHICIQSTYEGQTNWEKSVRQRAQLFNHILNYIINKSICCLDTLEIDVDPLTVHGWSNGFSALYHILSQFNSLPINTLLWKRDSFTKIRSATHTTRILKLIEDKLTTNCPNLKTFSFKLNSFGKNWVGEDIEPCVELATHIITPAISGYKCLETLELYCPSWNVFKTEYNIIGLIVNNLRQLKKLSITSYTAIDTHINIDNKHMLLEELNIDFVIQYNNTNNIAIIMECILLRLFESFIGIKHFQFGYSLIRDSIVYGPEHYPAHIAFKIDWNYIFSVLLKNKSVCGLKMNSLLCLESLVFKQIIVDDAISLLNDLNVLKDEVYVNLKHFGINIVGKKNWVSQSVFDSYVNNKLIPFINSFELKSLTFAYGNGYKILSKTSWGRCRYWWREYEQGWWIKPTVKVKPLYFQSIINLLSKLPKSLRSLNIKPPGYASCSDKIQNKIKQNESMRLVQKLCELLSENNDLESIVLDKVKLYRKAKDFLIFMFGYNNKMFF